MNKLNNPIVILALIILSISNMILSLSILAKIKSGNAVVDDADVINKEQSEQTTEPTTQVKKESLNFTVYDTTTDVYNSNWKANLKIDYSSSKEQNYSYLCRNIQSYCNSMYSVSCTEDQCLIYIHSGDKYNNPQSNEKLYSAEVSKNIIDRFESQEEITPDMLIDEKETSNGQIVMEFKSLPSYIIMRTGEDSNLHCYNIDDELLNYINSLR